MIFYCTYNEVFSGVYKSQVIDTMHYLRSIQNRKVVLIALISLRNFWRERKKIKSAEPGAKVLPMFPGIQNWQKNIFWLRRLLPKNQKLTIFCRGIFTANMASKLSEYNNLKIVYDARGAYQAEWTEFNFGAPETLIQNIPALEQNALNQADQCLVVSNALVDYWQENYNYRGAENKDFYVVPCTVSDTFYDAAQNEPTRDDKNSIRLVYAGSAAAWQMPDFWLKQVEQLMKDNEQIDLLLLTKSNDRIEALRHKFGDRVNLVWVHPEEVPLYMASGDYGILMREYAETNRVASPTKFAEYLSCGLDVLISPNIGDFSNFVEEKSCGSVVQKEDNLSEFIKQKTAGQKAYNRKLAQQYFLKEAYRVRFQALAKPLESTKQI